MLRWHGRMLVCSVVGLQKEDSHLATVSTVIITVSFLEVFRFLDFELVVIVVLKVGHLTSLSLAETHSRCGGGVCRYGCRHVGRLGTCVYPGIQFVSQS